MLETVFNLRLALSNIKKKNEKANGRSPTYEDYWTNGRTDEQANKVDHIKPIVANGFQKERL